MWVMVFSLNHSPNRSFRVMYFSFPKRNLFSMLNTSYDAAKTLLSRYIQIIEQGVAGRCESQMNITPTPLPT
jgi:hypothetical protein